MVEAAQGQAASEASSHFARRKTDSAPGLKGQSTPSSGRVRARGRILASRGGTALCARNRVACLCHRTKNNGRLAGYETILVYAIRVKSRAALWEPFLPGLWLVGSGAADKEEGSGGAVWKNNRCGLWLITRDAPDSEGGVCRRAVRQVLCCHVCPRCGGRMRGCVLSLA